MKCKIFISDEGFGPIIRQQAIITELRKLFPKLEVTIQTKRHAKEVNYFFKDITLVEKFNNIVWQKHKDGSPDEKAIKNFYRNYIPDSKLFINETIDNIDRDYDFFISDFVYEAFEIGKVLNIPCFGVAHFTWDWFLEKLNSNPVSENVIAYMRTLAKKATKIFFPPFTPRDIFLHYQNIKNVPFIVRHLKNTRPPIIKDSKFKVLIIDSGSSVLSHSFKRALSSFSKDETFQIFAASNISHGSPSITELPDQNLMIDFIPHMDLVVARAGFNTISECIAYRTPMLLVSEDFNPEMKENISNLENEGLAFFVPIKEFEYNFESTLESYIQKDYENKKTIMEFHDYQINGAKEVAKEIKDMVILH